MAVSNCHSLLILKPSDDPFPNLCGPPPTTPPQESPTGVFPYGWIWVPLGAKVVWIFSKFGHSGRSEHSSPAWELGFDGWFSKSFRSLK